MSHNIGHLKGIIDASDRVSGIVSELGVWLGNVRSVLRRNHERRVAIRELSALSDRQLTDIGIVRGQIPEIVQTLNAHKAVHERIANDKMVGARLGAGYCIGHS